MKHTLTKDGAPFINGNEVKGQIGAARCSCGWESRELGTRNSRRQAHADHKAEQAAEAELPPVQVDLLPDLGTFSEGLKATASKPAKAARARKARQEPQMGVSGDAAPEADTGTPQNHLSILVPEMDLLTIMLVGHLEKVDRATPAAQEAKMREEVDEWADGYSLGELADVVVVAFTAAHISGFNGDELLAAVLRKMRINSRRTWGTQGKVGKHQ